MTAVPRTHLTRVERLLRAFADVHPGEGLTALLLAATCS